MKISFVLCCIIFGVLYLICPIILAILYNKKNFNKPFSICLLSLYLIALFCGVFSQFSKSGDFILFYFDFSAPWASETISFEFWKVAQFDLAINLVLLFPIGVISSVLLSYKNVTLGKQILLVFIIGLCTGIFIEFMQFILPVKRTIQLSDVILNMLSCIIGSLYFILVNFIMIKTKKNRK